MQHHGILVLGVLCSAILVLPGGKALAQQPAIKLAGDRQRVEIPSSVDGKRQPCYVIVPKNLSRRPVPLLVSLHTWSGDVEQRNESLEEAAMAKGWIYLFPNFRGANQHPEACGSELAQQDILDAVAWAKKKYDIDESRTYLAGTSGGGHMTMLMVGRYPQVWTAASAWVGISDLAKWHDKHADGRYGEMVRLSCGGAPRTSDEVDKQYRGRSPLTWLDKAKDVPLDISAGIHDGHKGSVPIWHSLVAYNMLAKANGGLEITDAEIGQLSRADGRLVSPRKSDRVEDSSFGRAIYLRRLAGPSRITIFEGGHEGITAATIAWLEKHGGK
ncbi:MAG TPA: prolyl oligopeptidase [Planctomycetaceae bacterium]|nr:prolyl oligopeptidase [Planctomycetaceae bacterium]